MRQLRNAILAASLLTFAACSSVSNAPPPSPLPDTPIKTVAMWKASVGGETDFRFQPAFSGEHVVVAGSNSALSLLSRKDGKQIWQIKLTQPVSGGVGIDGEIIALGSQKGDVIALGLDGKIRWKVSTSSEVIAPPLVAGGLVVVRSGDGRLTAYEASTGGLRWVQTRPMPALLLRNYAPPVESGGIIFVGMPAGRLLAMALNDGRVLWDAPIALPRGASELERVTDIVAPPVVDGDMVCAVAFQGRLACLNARNGSLLWTREISSWSGMAIDTHNVYASDDKGQISAFERQTGRSMWRQDKLSYRFVTAPAVVGDRLVVGDMDGYLHFLDTEDGKLLFKAPTDGSRVYLAPQVAGSEALVQTSKGSVLLLGSGK